jgi:hypothetical protein
MTDLQHLCFYALEDMTLIQLNEKYFDNKGIGEMKRVIGGQANPMEFIQKIYCGRFDQKYQDKLIEYKRIKEESKGGW